MNKQLQEKKIRLIPGIILAILTAIFRYGLPVADYSLASIGIFGSLAGGLSILIWWAFFSRAKRFDRWFVPVLIILSLVITSLLLDKSISTAMMGMMYMMYAFPLTAVVFVMCAIATKRFSVKTRRITMMISIILTSGFWILLRTDGITGDVQQELKWRWAATHEEMLEDLSIESPVIEPVDSLFLTQEAQWPGFRGKNRDSKIEGIQIETDWATYPPIKVWRRPIGPGCSSFAVYKNMVFTQEQRGDYELVSCYDLQTGEAIWTHSDSARFWDSHAGAGPRSTPTFMKGKLYSLGATGILNALNAKNGSLIWSKDAAADAEVKHSGWGYCGSPIVTDELVIISVVGKILAYAIENGDLQWQTEDSGDGYSSPHLVNIKGTEQVLLTNANGIISVNPVDGSVLWDYTWEVEARIIQPAITENEDIIITNSTGKGIRRIEIENSSDKFNVKEVWHTSGMKPDFNDMVIHKGHAYGYQGMSLVCVNLEDGSRKWKEGRYGGQILLLSDQDLLIVLTEKGEIALVKTDTNELKELHRLSAIEGKTWNHPVLVNDILLIRNTQEMLALKLKVKT